VKETLVHIASLWRFDRFVHEEQHLASLEGFDFGALFKKAETEERLLRSKSDIVGLLQAQGDRWCQWVEGLSEALLSEQVRQPGGTLKNRFEMLVGTKDHEMHHRGQLMVMERMLGIVPHLTRNRQARRDGVVKSAK
jgi:uncharacterized damage-inducible protein DinB